MRRRILRRTGSLLLSLCLLIGLLPVSAWAVTIDDVADAGWTYSIPPTSIENCDLTVTVYQRWDTSVTPWVAEYAIVIAPDSSGSGNFDMPAKPAGGWPWEGDVTGITKYLIIADGVTGISDAAFAGMTNLEEAYLPASLTQIGGNAFSGSSKVVFNDAVDDAALDLSNVVSIGEGAFQNCAAMGGTAQAPVTVQFGDGLASIGASAFRNAGLNTITFAQNAPITEIGDYAFAGNQLSGISLPGNVTKLGESSFANNPFRTITLPESLQEIGARAFYRASSSQNTLVTDLVIPKSVTTIGEEAFCNYKGLKLIDVRSESLTLGDRAFGSDASNAYADDVTATLTYVDGDKPGEKEVKYHTGAAFLTYNDSVADTIRTGNGTTCYLGDLSPYLYSDLYSYPATCDGGAGDGSGAGKDVWTFTINGHDETFLYAEELDALAHSYATVEDGGQTDASCEVGAFALMECQKNITEGNLFWGIPAATEAHQWRDFSGSSDAGLDLDHNYQPQTITGMIGDTDGATITYQCENDFHSDDFDSVRKERQVTLTAAAITADTGMTFGDLTLPSVAGGRLSWNLAAIGDGIKNADHLPADLTSLPVIFIPNSTGATRYLPETSADKAGTELEIRVTVSKLPLDFSNIGFDNNIRFIGITNEDFDVIGEPDGVTANVTGASWKDAGGTPVGKPAEDAAAQPADYTVTVPFTYNKDVYTLGSGSITVNGLTIQDTGNGTGTISGPYYVRNPSFDALDANVKEDLVYNMQAQTTISVTGLIPNSTVKVEWRNPDTGNWELRGENIIPGTSADVAAFTDAGTYEVRISVSNGTYTPETILFTVGSDKGPVTIARRPVTAPTARENLVYDGTEQTGLTPSADNAFYQVTSGGTGTDAGNDYQAVVTLDIANCYWADLGDTSQEASKTIPWAIGKREIPRPIIDNPYNHTYDGTEQTAVTGSLYTGGDFSVANGEGGILVGSYQDEPIFTITAARGTNAGRYKPKATIDLADLGNFYWENDDTQQVQTIDVRRSTGDDNFWILSRKTLTVGLPTVNDNIVYTGLDFVADRNVTPPELTGEAAAILEQDSRTPYLYYTSAGQPMDSVPRNAGPYQVAVQYKTICGEDISNYSIQYQTAEGTPAANGRVTLDIKPAPLTLTAPSDDELTVPYDGSAHAVPKPGYDGLVGDDQNVENPEGNIFTFRYGVTPADETGDSKTPPTRTAVGEYRVTVSIQSTNYYGVGNDVGGTTNTLDYTWTIQAAENTVALTDESITEGDNTVAPDGIVEKPLTHAPFTILGTPSCSSEGEGDETVEATVTYVLDDDPSNPQDVIRVDKTTGLITPLKVGTAKVNVTVSPLINYGETTVSFSVKVTPGTPEAEVEDQTFPYGTDISNPGNDLKPYNDLSNVTITGSAQEGAVKPTEPSADNLTFTLYDTADHANAGGDAGKITDVSGLGAGTYHLRVDYAGDANYASAFDVGTLTVSSIRMDAAPVSDMEFNYDGSDHYNEMVQKVKDAVTAPEDKDLTVTIIKANSGESTAPEESSDRWNGAAPSVVNVGTDEGLYFYRIQAENYATVTGSFQVTINPAELTVDAVTLEKTTKTYDGTTGIPEGNPDMDSLPVTGAVGSESITASAEAAYTSKNATAENGANIDIKYTITFKNGVLPSNYTYGDAGVEIVENGQTWTFTRTVSGTIEKRPLTNISGITAVGRDYNGTIFVELAAESGITFTGKVEPDDVTLSLRAGATGTLQPSAPGADDAANAGNDKDVTVQPGDIEITGEDAGNYDIETAYTTQVDIAKAQRTLTFDQDEDGNLAFSVSYDGKPLDDTDLAVTVTGYADGDPQATVEYKFYSNESYSTEIDQSATSAAGTYYVTVILKEEPNYALVEVEAVITVDRSELTITPDNPTYTGTYNGASHKDAILDVITVAGIGGELTLGTDYQLAFQEKTGDTAPGADDDGWVSSDEMEFVNAETTTYWVRVDAESYRSRVVEMEITIRPAALTVDVTLDTEKSYDGKVWMENGSEAPVEGSYTVTTQDVTTAGTDITGVSVTARYTDANVNPADGNPKGIQLVYTVSFASETARGNYQLTGAQINGTAITLGNTSAAGNALTANATGSGVLTPAGVAVTIHNQTFPYSNSTPKLVETEGAAETGGWSVSSGTVFAQDGKKDDLGIDLALGPNDAVNAGDYAITGTWTNPNYAVTFSGSWSDGKAGTCTIGQKAITIRIGNDSGVYGDEPNLSDVTFTDVNGGLADGDRLSDILTTRNLSTTVTADSDAGTTGDITAVPTGSKKDNYNITWENGTYTQSVRLMTVTLNNQSSTYGTAHTVGQEAYTLTAADQDNDVVQADLANDALEFTLTAGDPSIAGDPTARAVSYPIAGAYSGDGMDNYRITFVGETAFGGDAAKGTYTIGKAVLTVAPDRPVVYAQYNQSIANPLTFTNASVTDGEITAGSADYNALSAVVSYVFQPADGLTLTSTGDRAAGEFTVNVSNQTVTVTVTVPETDNFEEATASYAVQASSSGDLNVRLPFAERTYNGTAQQLLREGPALPEGIAIRYKVGESGTWTAYSSEDSENWKQVTGTDAVAYTVYWETTAGGGYSASSGSAVTSIAQAEIVGTFTDLPDGSISFLLAEIPDKYVIPLDLSQNPNYTHIDGSGVSYFSNNLDVASALNGTATLELRGGTGTAEITITCLGDTNYKATTLKFTVTVSETMQEIKVDTSTTGDQSVPYNGEAQTIQPVKAQNLAEGDYAVHYWNEQTQQYDLTEPPAYVDVKRPAGDATGTPEAYVIGYQITATGYTPATGTVNLTITPKAVTAGMFEKSIGFYTYTGMPITPEPVVVDENALLAEVTDYTVDWGTNTAPGEDAGSVTVTGQGNYTSSATVTFNINPVGSGLTALLSPGYGVYDPAAPATATVTVTHHTASDHEVSLTPDNTVYDITARDLTTGVEITDHGATGSGDTLTFTQPSVYDITLALTGDHVGTFHFTYTLLPMSGGDGGLTLTVGDEPQKVYTYGDTDIDGVIQVMVGEADVTSQCDLTYVYTPFDGTGTTEPAKYEAGVLQEAGVYTVTATPNDASVTGTGTFVFLIQQRNLAEAKLTVAGDDLTYNGAAQEPAVTVSLAGNPEENKDYTVSYHDNVSASVNGAQAVITATGNNFTGSAGAAFSIAPKPITDSSVVIGAIDDQPYTGGPIYPALTITDTDIVVDAGTDEKYVLVLGHDYTVSCENGSNVSPGTATLTITGTGNYDDSTEVSFTITSEPAPEPEEEFILSVTPDSTWVYGRAPADLDLSVTFGEDNELILGTDYTLTVIGVIYDDTDGRTLADAIAAIKALEPGDYTVTAQGTGIYGASSDTASLTVRKIPTTVDVAVSPSSLSGGGTVTLTLQGTDLPAGTDLSALLTVSTANGTDLALEDLEWTQAGGVWTASFNAANANETYTFTLRFAGDAYYEGDSDTALLVTARRTSGGGGGGGGGTVDPEPEEPTVADPDDTGVSDWLNTDDHMAYLSGYPDGTFGPNQNMTRAEAAQMFYNLLLDKDVAITTSFSDVDGGTWYANAVNTLASLGIINGVGGDRFEPERSITRAEFTAIAMRFAHLETGGENRFSDVREEDWFYDIVVGSIQYGWINGYPDGTFRPDSSITRSEVTTITNRMLGRSADEDYADRHVEDLRSFSDLRDTHWAYYDICEAANAHDYRKSGGEENWTGLN